MGKWRSLIEQATRENQFVKCQPAASDTDIQAVENALNIKLPQDLKSLLYELNGDQWFVFSTSQIIEVNITVRKAMTSAMPLDCLLFVAGNGCGDYYGYPITADGIKDWEIFMWDHESDNRNYKAQGLEDAVRKYYNDEI